ncbi:hypothetical protein CSB45_06285 [candidate division KSB3 bacterium]|uniref:Glycosyltransferase 2-like domain-containing protein n=1 Tax=candidate division KSB3 bacterium TaxID=2044937 RepID=A0A2G6E6Z6_9BACT|nr:MAG: hypothetical protein CSB45_06285 [candidate division KSB3 bacterium]PIE30251.1 MAG: hypothetical protein CSA57_05000 [candidate division KSB3 bacterium]
MSLPLMSIVTPSFNQLIFLKVCVAGIEMQAYPLVEQIVLDGGSTDGTKEYLAKKPGHVTCWRSHPDKGQTQALNEGFAKVSGDWIGWQNSDDFYYPGAFWRIADISRQAPEVQVVAGDTAIVDEHGVKKNLVGIAPVPAKTWLQGYWPYNQSLFIRRSLLEQVMPLDERFHLHMDIELFAKIAVLEPKVAYINSPLGAFRKYTGIKTDNPHYEEQRQWERAALRERFQEPMWPGTGWRYQRFRAKFHVEALRSWGWKALAKRAANVADRSGCDFLIRS